MSLAESIRKGYTTYIHALGYDPHRAHLIILFLKNAEEDIIARTLIFRGVHHFTTTWFADAPVPDFDLDSIIGFDTYIDEQQTKYVIHTECREIMFETTIPPEIIEHI